MATTLGSLRNLLMTPALADVGFAKRGFPVVETEATRRLEAVPQAVICGFEWGIDSRTLWEVQRRLELVEPEMRGFAYEGATMAFTIRDATAAGRGTRTRELLMGPGRPHIFLTYIGIGFAMARLPRPLWKNVMPDLSGVPYHPTMSWLAVDGLGFDRAYFDTDKWVGAGRRPRPYPFAGHRQYFARAWDQGVGRALWFIHGAGVADVAASVRRFESDRQADLWSGVGLAATFAGGATPQDLARLRELAGAYAPDLAQGSVFAAKARSYSGFVPSHSEKAVSVLTGITLEEAAEFADTVAVGGLKASDGMPEYEVWRSRIRARFPSAATVRAN